VGWVAQKFDAGRASELLARTGPAENLTIMSVTGLTANAFLAAHALTSSQSVHSPILRLAER
jgi:hypothetical protein